MGVAGSIDPGRLTNTGLELLDCVQAGLALTAAGAPPRACLYPGGDPPWDACECGSTTIYVPRTYQSESFPDIKTRTKNCLPNFTVAEYVVRVLRCDPAPQDNGQPPTCTTMNLAAAVDLDDRQAVLQAIKCCLGSNLYLFGDQLGVGGQGLCVGSETSVLVPFSNCRPCPEGVF